jgi:large subunit ribosomal protein L17
MRHLNSVNKLNKTASHRHAMLSNLAMSILDKERVITTLAKAKVVRGVVERLITHAKKGGLHKVRVVAETIQDKAILTKLFSDIAPSYKDREGGYTRILKLRRRPGDDALLCIIELTGRNSQELALARKKKKKTPAAGEPSAAAEAKAAGQASDAKGEAAGDEGKADDAKKAKPKAAPKRKKKAEGAEGDAKPDKEDKKK